MNYIRSHLRGQGAKVHWQSGYPGQTANWIQDEFASIDLGDKRLDQRFFSILESFSSQPDASIPQSSGSWDKLKGAYRFMDNPQVTPFKILDPHFERTKSRIRDEEVALAVTLSVIIPRRKGKPERVASVEVRFAPVTIKSPRNNRSQVPSVEVWGIYINEPSPPENEEPLSWMLLTTLEVETTEDAIRYIDYYSVRFSIELFHKVLKSGCNIEKHQLKTAERLINCLAIDAIVAWRVMFLTMMGRSVPDLPCTVLFEEHEWKALYCFANKTQKPPEQPPSLGEAVSLVAKLGGFLGRKSDGQPGVQVLWRGMKILSVISGAWTAFGPESTSLPGLS
ncbi:MAG: IS4 family transposase [PVC group bacterium]